MATLTFYGAVTDVTGSCYLIETQHSRILMECGLFQGDSATEKQNEAPFPFDASTLDAVVLSHAHLDHSGRLPKLIKEGFQGVIYMTRATAELLDVMLKDSANLMARDIEWVNKRRKRAGKPEVSPLYSIEDVEATLNKCRGIYYQKQQKITTDINVRFQDAGHILGSAIVELFVKDDNAKGEHRHKKLVFTGDLGNSCAALLRDPETITDADVVLMESTYGDRNHKPLQETLDEFNQILEDAAVSGGNVIIPAFAVGRTQELLFRLGERYQDNKLKQQAVFLDSPMAIATTEIYHRFQDIFNDEDTLSLRQAHASSLHRWLPTLQYSRTPEESMALNRFTGGAIIIAGSGMCTGGRVGHHLKHNLWRREAHILIVGYQARGTLGRRLVDGAKVVHLFGEEISVNATIHTLGGFSAHAGQSQLLQWASHFHKPRPPLYLVHGEPESKSSLVKALQNELQWHGTIAQDRQTITF